MKKFLICCIILVPVTITSAPRAEQTPKPDVVRATQQEEPVDPVPQIMIANVFNILANGIQMAANADNKKEKAQAAANITQSIGALLQLAVRTHEQALTQEDIEEFAHKLMQAIKHTAQKMGLSKEQVIRILSTFLACCDSEASAIAATKVGKQSSMSTRQTRSINRFKQWPFLNE